MYVSADDDCSTSVLVPNNKKSLGPRGAERRGEERRRSGAACLQVAMLAYSRQRCCTGAARAAAAASKSYYQGRHEQKRQLVEGTMGRGCWVLELARSYTWRSPSQPRTTPVASFSRPMQLVATRGAKRGATPSTAPTSTKPTQSHPQNKQKQGGIQHPDVNSTSDLFVRWEVPWDGKRVVLTLAALAGSSLLSGLVTSIGFFGFGYKPGQPLNADVISTFLCSTILLQTLFGLYVMKACFKRYSPLPKELFSYDWRNPFSARRGWFLWGVVGMFCAVLAVGLVGLIINKEGFSMNTDILLQLSPSIGASGTSTTLVLVTVGVLAPLLEEIIFRGFLLTSLTKWVPTSAAVLMSAGAFSLVHLNPGKSPILFVLGIVLGFSYSKTGNLLTPIMIHGVWNSMVILLLLFLHYRGVDIRKLLESQEGDVEIRKMLESPEGPLRWLADQRSASAEKK